MRGVSFVETMTGSFHFVDRPLEERPLSFSIRARSSGSLLGFALRPVTEIEGAIDADGLAHHRRLWGTLDIDALRTGELRYDFSFEGDDGQLYAFHGHKTLRVTALAESISVLPGAIVNVAGSAVGEALLRFDLKSDLGRFLKNIRVRF